MGADKTGGATHSNCRAIADVARNLTDEQIRAIAGTGVVVCVVFYPGFLEPGWKAKKDALEAEIQPLVEEAGRGAVGRGSARRIACDRVRGREYAARLEHVGCGSDSTAYRPRPPASPRSPSFRT